MSSPLIIRNRDARRLWLNAQGLSATPTGPLKVAEMIQQLGFVQLDTIRVVSRAHHHILWSRNQNYREPMLWNCLAKDRSVFEHFTHDASILPIETYPMWRRQFDRLEAKVKKWEWHRNMLDADGRNTILERIRDEGPLSTKAFDTKISGKREMWKRPPHKLALDYLWYAGELSTCHRENFTKFYDLTERVIPDGVRGVSIPEMDQIKWLCREAMKRLGFGTAGDLQRFWNAVSLNEAKFWLKENEDALKPVVIQHSDGKTSAAFAPKNIETLIDDLPTPTSRLRILNPFDPVVRDRARLSKLFGFDFRIEIFVPAAKRKWGYYVYPMLEGDRFVGRIEVRADRKKDQLEVLNVWPEAGVKWTPARKNKLDAELARLARLAGTTKLVWV